MSSNPEHQHKCPACGATLVLDKLRLDCPSCGGTFVDGDELGAILLGADETPEIQWVDSAESTRRQCPLCEIRMHAAFLWKVPVERCGVHGTWFDVGELPKLLEAEGCPAESSELPDARPRE